jgi:hypothetical protein
LEQAGGCGPLAGSGAASSEKAMGRHLIEAKTLALKCGIRVAVFALCFSARVLLVGKELYLLK